MNKYIQRTTIGLLSLVFGLTAVTVPAYAMTHSDKDMDTIVEIASASTDLETLVAAASAANLVDALNTGPITVFAPVDDAFSALGVDTINELLKPENIEKLTSILTYHVANGKTLSTDLSDGMMITTLNGQQLSVSINQAGVQINNANVITADIMASNGVVHLIDAVLMPDNSKMEEEKPSIVGIATSDDAFSSLVAAVSSQNLVETLDTDGPFTVFAPTNDAFSKLPVFATEAIARDPSLLTDILLYHVVPGKIKSSDIKRHQVVTTVEGSKLIARASSEGVQIDKATVTSADIYASNGIVHVIDQVLIPRSLILDELKRVQEELQTILNLLRSR